MSTKDKVLLDLEKRKGVPVSGTIIANKLGVSRTAVWKAINALRAEGHVIKGGSGIGYVLDQKSDVLSEAGISDQLSEHIALHVFEEIDSTNKEAKRLAISEPSEPLLIIADRQTEGRGRFGRSFYSPSGTGLYMSLLFRPEFSADRAGLATAAASVAVCRAAKKVAGRQCGIKWVNDVYYNGKKICGILTEGVTGIESKTIDYMVIGIGINCHPADISGEAGDRAGDLGGGFSRNDMAAAVVNELLPLIRKLDPRQFMDEYRSASIVIGEDIRIFGSGIGNRMSDQSQTDSGVPAHVTDISDQAGLMVVYADGRSETLTSGEITIRKEIKS